MEQRKRRRKRNGQEEAAPLPRALQDGVLTTELGDEVVVYHARQHRGHCLNPSAAVVWRNLDGRTSMAEMVERLEKALGAEANEDVVWLALKELDQAELLDGPLQLPARGVSRRNVLGRLGAAAVLLPAISSVVAPPAHAQASAVGCSPPDTCATFTCAGGCACVPTTEGATVCIVPTCVAPCTTTADCPPGTVCFTLGCCGPATYCVPIAPVGTQCLTRGQTPWQHR